MIAEERMQGMQEGKVKKERKTTAISASFFLSQVKVCATNTVVAVKTRTSTLRNAV